MKLEPGLVENQWSVRDEPVEFKNLKFETSGNLPIILKVCIAYALNE